MGASRASLTSSGGSPQATVEIDLISLGGPLRQKSKKKILQRYERKKLLDVFVYGLAHAYKKFSRVCHDDRVSIIGSQLKIRFCFFFPVRFLARECVYLFSLRFG